MQKVNSSVPTAIGWSRSRGALQLNAANSQQATPTTFRSMSSSNVTSDLLHKMQASYSFALFLLVSISFGINSTPDMYCHALAPNTETSAQPFESTTTTATAIKAANQTLDFKALEREFQQDNSKTDTLIKVINDTHGIDGKTRQKLYNLISEYKSTDSIDHNKRNGSNNGIPSASRPSGSEQQLVKSRGKHRQIVYEDTIFTKRALREFEANMNISYEGESKSDPAIHWVILYNDTTILVVRSANKYYYWTYVQSVSSLVIFCMIVVGNLSILHRLKSCRRRRSNVNYFIVQLAIADLLVGIFSVTLDSWLRIQKAFLWGLLACRASKYISVLFIYSSTNLLVALSVDRWEAVVKPLAFTRNRSRGHHLVAASWVLAFISALPVTLFTKIKEIDGLPQCWIDLNTYGWRLYMLYLTSLLLIVPTIIIAVCYIHIVYTIWSKGRLVSDQKHRRERSSHANYCASPESLNQDFSSSSRLHAKSSNFIDDSSCLERDSSRRISWGRRCKRSVSRDKHGIVIASKSTTSSLVSSRRASTDSSLGQERRARFRRSRTIEVGPAGKQQHQPKQLQGNNSARASARSNQRTRLDESIKPIPMSLTGAVANDNNHNNDLQISDCNNNNERNSNLVNICASNFAVETNLHNEDHNQKESLSRRGGTTGETKHQAETRSQTESGAKQADNNNKNDGDNRKDALRMMDNEQSSSLTRPSLTRADQSPTSHQSSLSRVASQGLRILSFARSSSGLSSGSMSSSASSPSTLSSKSRLAVCVSARSSVATQIMSPAVTACAIGHSEAQRAQVRLTSGKPLAGQSDTDLNDNDRRQTIAPDVPDRTGQSQRATVFVEEAVFGCKQPDDGDAVDDDDIDGVEADRATIGWDQTDKFQSGSTTTSSTRVRSADKLRRSSYRQTNIVRRFSQKRKLSLSHKHNSTVECDQMSELESKQGSNVKAFANMITMTTSEKNLSSSIRCNPSETSINVDMQTDSQTISKNCDRMTKVGKRNSDADKQCSLSYQQQRRRPSSTEYRQASGGGSSGRDQDFVAQQHGSGVIPKARIKTIKMTLVIVVAYILCWSPFLIVNLFGVFGLIKNDTNVSHALLTLSQSLAHLNSAVNPIIFWLFSSRRSPTNTNTVNTVAGGLWTTNHQPNNHQQHNRQPNKIATNGAL